MSFSLKSQRRLSGHVQLRETACVCLRTRRIDSYANVFSVLRPLGVWLNMHLGQPSAKTARALDVNFPNHRIRKFPPWAKEGVRKVEDERPVTTRSVRTTGVGVTKNIPPLSVTRIR